MSIDRETFERASEEDLEGLSVADRVLGFLVTNGEQAFKALEIAHRIEADRESVSTALTRLKNRGLVDHKGTYWAVTSDTERLESYGGYARATALFNEQFGEEDRSVWEDHAPDEPHPSRSEEER